MHLALFVCLFVFYYKIWPSLQTQIYPLRIWKIIKLKPVYFFFQYHQQHRIVIWSDHYIFININLFELTTVFFFCCLLSDDNNNHNKWCLYMMYLCECKKKFIASFTDDNHDDDHVFRFNTSSWFKLFWYYDHLIFILDFSFSLIVMAIDGYYWVVGKNVCLKKFSLDHHLIFSSDFFSGDEGLIECFFFCCWFLVDELVCYTLSGHK